MLDSVSVPVLELSEAFAFEEHLVELVEDDSGRSTSFYSAPLTFVLVR